MKLLVFSLLVLVSSLSQAIGLSKWPQLVEKIVATGKIDEIMEGQVRSLSNIVPEDITQSHQANYVHTLGLVMSDGVYKVTQSGATSETWTRQGDGAFVVEQWHFLPDSDGEIEVKHGSFHRDVDGMVTEKTALPIDESVAEEVWNKVVSHWIQ